MGCIKVLVLIVALALPLMGWAATPAGPCEPRSWDGVKIVPAPGITLGQYDLHCIDYYMSGFPSFGLPEDTLISMSFWFTELNATYAQVQAVTTHPILMSELSFSDGMNTSSARAATKLTTGLETFLSTYPQIRAVTFWSNFLPNWPLVDVFPFDTLIRDGSLQDVITNHPGQFHGCAAFSHGYTRRECVD